MTKRTAATERDWNYAELGKGLTPAFWHCWEAYELIEAPNGFIAEARGVQLPTTLDNAMLGSVLAVAVQFAERFDEVVAVMSRKLGSLLCDGERVSELSPSLDGVAAVYLAMQRSDCELASAVLTTLGPLTPADPDAVREPYLNHHLNSGTAEPFVFAPRVPERVEMHGMLLELAQLGRAMKMVAALDRSQIDILDDCLAHVAAPELLGVPLDWIRDRAERLAAQYNRPGGPFGAFLEWMEWMATRWPLSMGASLAHKSQLVPNPRRLSPVQALWLAMAHQAGALTLPYERRGIPRVGFCAECNAPIFSSRPRYRGVNMFCDPPSDKDRSPCQNRYQSRIGKKRQREKARDAREKGGF